MSKLEVVKVKLGSKEVSLDEYLKYLDRLEVNRIKEILSLDIEEVEFRKIDIPDRDRSRSMKIVTINNDIDIQRPVFTDRRNYVELKFDDKSFRVYEGSRITSKYYYNNLFNAISGMLTDQKTTTKVVEVKVNGESKKINTSVSQEDAQNIIDQIL